MKKIFTWELSRLFKWRIPLNSLLRGSQAASNNSPNAFCFSISRGQLLINTMTPKSFVHKSQVQLKSQFLISLEIHPVTDSVETYNKTITCLNPKRTRQERTCTESNRTAFSKVFNASKNWKQSGVDHHSVGTKFIMALIWQNLLRFHPGLIL